MGGVGCRSLVSCSFPHKTHQDVPLKNPFFQSLREKEPAKLNLFFLCVFSLSYNFVSEFCEVLIFYSICLRF